MTANVDGIFLCMQAEFWQMSAQGSGAIVNMSSGAGLIGAPMMSAYSASKHAVLGLTRSVAREYIAKGIRINSVCPAEIETPMLVGIIPGEETRAGVAAQHIGGRNGAPEEAAAMVLFACSEEASYSTGVEFKVNGGTAF